VSERIALALERIAAAMERDVQMREDSYRKLDGLLANQAVVAKKPSKQLPDWLKVVDSDKP
jgi:hypothetical protein